MMREVFRKLWTAWGYFVVGYMVLWFAGCIIYKLHGGKVNIFSDSGQEYLLERAPYKVCVFLGGGEGCEFRK